MNNEYINILNDIKKQIANSRNKAMISVNQEVIISYFKIGCIILERNKWGESFIRSLSTDLKITFPGIKGMSETNLKYMQTFAKAYSIDYLISQQIADQIIEKEFSPQPGGQLRKSEISPHPVAKIESDSIPPQPVGELRKIEFSPQSGDQLENVLKILCCISWRANKILLDKLNANEERLWYARKAIENNWSSTVLLHQISSKLIERQNTNKTTNFLETLDKVSGERIQELFKDEYIFDFINLKEKSLERDIQKALTNNITSLLLEFGQGFAFVGENYHLEVGEENFYIDLLFYNIKEHCYVVIELKTDKFKPEYTGKLSFYLSAVDNLLKTNIDNPTIGILLCKEKNSVVTEFALKDINKPVGVAKYLYSNEIPNHLKNILPTIDKIKETLKSK